LTFDPETQEAGDLHRKQVVAPFLLAACVCSLGYFVWNCVRALSVKGPIWYEGPVLGFLNTIRLGRLYQLEALHSEPYSVLTHTPFAYLLDYGVYSVFPAYWSLRLVNILLTVGCALLVANLSRLENRDRGITNWFAEAVFLVCTPVFFWSQVARCVDALACLSSLAVLTVLVGMTSSLRRELAIGAFWALAVLSKQTAAVVLAPVLFGYDWFVTRERSRIFWRFLFCGAVLLPVLIYLQWSTHGGFFQNVVMGNLVEANAGWWLMVMLRLKGFWLMCGAVTLLGGVRKSATSIWFVTSLAFGLLGVSKVGADIMYFFDASAALAVLAAGVVIRLPQLRRPMLARAALTLGILAMCWNDRNWLVKSGDKDYRDMIAWLSSNASGKGQILSVDAGIPLALGQNPVFDDPFIFAEWAKRGAWSDEPLLAGIRAGKYSAIIMAPGNDFAWSPAVNAEIASRYTFAKAFHSLRPVGKYIYVPLAAVAAKDTRLEPSSLSLDEKRGSSCCRPASPRPN
jgi:hypothetical protein